VDTPDQFGNLVLRQVEGHPVQINDVARVDDGGAGVTTLANINGDPTVLLQIRKQSGTNTVEVVNNVKDRLDELKQALAPGYELRIVRDQAEFIEASFRSVEEHLVVGSFLAAFVVLLFLGNLRSTIIAAIAIPTSIIATFALVWYAGFTLNMLTMLALTLSVGIVIDDAIVVLENIYRFIEEKGMPPIRAAVEGTREIGLAVLATTLSLVAIFAPVGFMSGMVGRFMRSFGLTMAFAVMVSLLVSFTLTPTMCARWLKVKPREEDESHHIHDSKHSKIFGPIDRIYTRMLEWSMAHRGIVAALAVLVLFSSVPIFRMVNVNFTPNDDQSEFDVSLRAPEGTSLEATEVLANRVATAIRRVPEVTYTMITVAGDSAGTLNTASIYVRLREIGERSRDQFEIMEQVRNDVLPASGGPGIRTSLTAPGIGGGGGGGGQAQGDVMFVMQGPSLAELERASNVLAEKARQIPGLVDVDTSLRVGKPEMAVRLDRPKAADLGVQIADAAEALRLLVGGDQVTTYNEAGEQYEVHLRAEEQNRGSEAAIARLTVPSSRLGAVPLENIASFTHGDAPADIRRLNRQRQVT